MDGKRFYPIFCLIIRTVKGYNMDIVMRKGTEKKIFWDFEDGEYRDITNGLGTVYSAEEFNKLYNDLVSDGREEQDYRIVKTANVSGNISR